MRSLVLRAMTITVVTTMLMAHRLIAMLITMRLLRVVLGGTLLTACP